MELAPKSPKGDFIYPHRTWSGLCRLSAFFIFFKLNTVEFHGSFLSFQGNPGSDPLSSQCTVEVTGFVT